MATRTALVAGVTGIVGFELSNELLRQGWTVYGVSRRKPDYLDEKIHHVAVDLTDAESCKQSLGLLTSITHVFYATWLAMPTEDENCHVNTAMITNLIDNLPSKIQHFALVTGTKHYVGPFTNFTTDPMPIPFKEDLPRLKTRNFYYEQEDVLFDRAAKNGFAWSVARPATILGFAPRNQMNLAQSVAVIASVYKHLNQPLKFPGSKAMYDVLIDMSDTTLIAKHLIWQSTTPECENQAFNVVNGDVQRYRLVWPKFAEYFGMEVGEPEDEPANLREEFKKMRPLWDEIVAKYGLQKFTFDALVTDWFVELLFNAPLNVLNDMSKSRELGFTVYQNTEKSWTKLFDYLRENKYIP